MDEALRRKIEERAHELWQADGSPDGRSWEYWLKAERELAASPAPSAEDPLEPMEHGPVPRSSTVETKSR